MDHHHNSWISSMKRRLSNVLSNDYFTRNGKSMGCSCAEKLPPRLHVRGISVAARVMGNEIREFTMRNTGKDLAQLRNSERRNKIISKMTKLKIAFTNNEAKYSYLQLAYNHNSNLTSSLSPEGEDHSIGGSEFQKHELHGFISKYYKQCLQDCESLPSLSKRKKHIVQNISLTEKVDISKDGKEKLDTLCSCHDSAQEEQRQTLTPQFLSCWMHNGVADTDLARYCSDNVDHFASENKISELTLREKDGWQEFVRNKQCIVFRKKLETGVYEYRVQAAFLDISANHLFKTQVDGDYRKTWDDYIVNFDIVDSDKSTNTELIHWITRCPYPFATREYIYLRRRKVDEDNKMLVLYQQATSDANIPRDNRIQRVDNYVSKLIIKPHGSDFDEKGCDFLLTYYDDPKMMLPARVLDLAASKGIQDSVKLMHVAALGLVRDKGD